MTFLLVSKFFAILQTNKQTKRKGSILLSDSQSPFLYFNYRVCSDLLITMKKNIGE